jgi:excisionase family DNA binding protein
VSAPLGGPITIDATLRTMIVQIVRDEMARAAASAAPRDEYLSPRAAGAVAQVAAGTVRRWVREGKLAGHHAGRVLRVRRADLEALLRRPRAISVDHVEPEALARRLFG